MVLARHRISCVELEEIPLPASPIDACSLIVFPSDNMGECFRVTGVYCPPPPSSPQDKEGDVTEGAVRFRPSQQKVEMIFGHKTATVGGDAVCGHLVLGDLNPRTWADGFQQWMAEGGAWELSDPSQSTHKNGGALDKIIFQPWAEVPDCFLHPTGGEEIDYEWSLRGGGIFTLQ